MKCSVKQRGKFFIVVDPFHHKSYTLNNRLSAESLEVTLNKLHEENEELDSFKKLVYLVLKKEYDLRMNEMNILAEKEDWQGYMATKLERGTAQRIAKRLGVDL